MLKFMSETWLKFLEGKIDAKAVLDKYKEQGSMNRPKPDVSETSPWNPDKEQGFNVNQDIPGNMLWEELYAASPKGQKVSSKVIKGHSRSWKYSGYLDG